MAVISSSINPKNARNPVPIIRKDAFLRLSRVQRAALLVMQEYGEVTIIDDVHEERQGKEQNPALRMVAP